VLDVNGFSKVDIIKKYLYEREKNEHFYETYLIKKTDNPTNTRTTLTKTAVKPKQSTTPQSKQPTPSTPAKTTKPSKAK
jgi:hypothetical protein